MNTSLLQILIKTKMASILNLNVLTTYIFNYEIDNL